MMPMVRHVKAGRLIDFRVIDEFQGDINNDLIGDPGVNRWIPSRY